MAEKLYTCGNTKKGGAFYPILKMLNHFHGVENEELNKQKRGVCLYHNTLPEIGLSSKMRKVVFIGGYKTSQHGVPRDFAWDKADHIVFRSKFFTSIARSKYKFGKHSVMNILGGAHGDPNMMIPLEPKLDPIDGTIHFVMVAKWYKRSYKRLKPSKILFRDHIQKEFPDSKLHIFGHKLKEDKIDGNIINYKKSFGSEKLMDVYKKSHIHLMLSPFDSGPMTINEAMHYRLPFVCSNNCCGKEMISMIDGVCGEVVRVDPLMKTYKDCKKWKPMVDDKFYARPLDNELIMEGIRKVINDYPTYTSWNWTESFNYKAYADRWMEILFGK